MNTAQIVKAAQIYPRSVQDKLIPKREAAKLLSLSTRTLDRMADRGLIEKIFVDSTVRFRLSDINAIIQGGA